MNSLDFYHVYFLVGRLLTVYSTSLAFALLVVCPALEHALAHAHAHARPQAQAGAYPTRAGVCVSGWQFGSGYCSRTKTIH